MSDDLIIENLLDHNEEKKKIKSGRKGKAGERDIVHALNDRFSKLLLEHPTWGLFSRSVGSGNRWGQNVILSEQAKQVYASDITCPDNFLFVIESKKGYNHIDLCAIFSGKCPDLDAFLKQVQDDADRVGRKPLLIWKKDRKPAIAFLKDQPICDPNPAIYLRYGDWWALSFEVLLATTSDTFWFFLDGGLVSATT